MSAVIFVDGCFWHGHVCHMFRRPRSCESYWHAEITGNMECDRAQRAALADADWRIGTVRECALTGKTRLLLDSVVDRWAA